MGKIKEEKNWYLCAFLLPFVAGVAICIRNGVYPFGENCILHIDMYHQYEPFFTELMDKLKHGGSLLYSFRIGLGSDFVSLISYYLASPFNFLLILCPQSHVIEFMTVLILVKIGLCGMNFAAYLRGHYGEWKPETVVFSAIYALSGYMAAYSWNIMWLDVVFLAPLVVLGLERLVKEKRCRLYCGCLALAILSNFYLAFMLCIFLALYYVVYCLEEVKGIKKRVQSFGRFVFYSVLAGGIGAVLIIPEAIILSYSGSSGIRFPQAVEWYFDLCSMLVRHCVNVSSYTGRDHWPNLYCGAAIFLFLTFYFCNRKIPRRKKIARAVWIVLFWISFSNNILDFFWHGLHFPDSLPGRQVFLYTLLLIVMAYEAFVYQEGNKIRDFVPGVLVSAAFLAAAVYTSGGNLVTRNDILLTGAFLALYIIILFLWRVGHRDIQGFMRYTFLALVVCELFVNFSITGLGTTSRTSYTQNWTSVKSLLAGVNDKDETAFYRIEHMERLTKNDAAVYGYPSSTIFSSMMNIGVSRFYRYLGMEGGKNFYSYSGATPLSSAMLSVKYLIGKNPYEDSPLRTLVADDGVNYIYENKYTLPLGFMMDVDFESRWDVVRGAPINNLNRLASLLGADGLMLQKLEGAAEVKEDVTKVTVDEDCYLYGTYTDTSVTNITVQNGKRTRKFSKCDHGYILDLGWCKAGDVVEITNTSDVKNFEVQVYRLNVLAVEQAYAVLNEQAMTVDQFDDTKIRGHVNVKRPGNLVVSVPMEAGWHVFVDGEEIEAGVFMESMMKIPLVSGEHEIELRYRTPGLLLGGGISAVCLLVFVWICVVKWRRDALNML